MTKLEKFHEACAAAQDAPIQIYGEKVKAMNAAYDDFKQEPDIVEQASTLVDDPNPMVRYMVAVIIRPLHRERSDAMFKAIAEGEYGAARTWAIVSEAQWANS